MHSPRILPAFEKEAAFENEYQWREPRQLDLAAQQAPKEMQLEMGKSTMPSRAE